MTTQPQIILLFGRPGTGKYTVGRTLAEVTGFRLLHNHAVVDLVTALFPFGTAPFIELRERLWLDAVDAALAAPLPGLILTFAPERTVTDGFLPTLQQRVRAGGGALRFVELRCAAGELERRMVEPSRGRFGKLRDAALYRQLDADGVFERPIMPDAELVLETDTLDATEAAKRIAEVLGEESGSMLDARC